MAIALDQTAVSTDQTASPVTWNHTIIDGPNRLLIVGVALNATVNAPTATGVTFGGISMNKIRADVENGTTDKMETSIWFLHAPPIGTNSVSVSFTGGTSPHGAGGSVSYFGAIQSDSADANNGTTGTASGSQSFTVTTILDNCWVFAIGCNVATTTPTLAANQTSRGTVNLANTQPGILRIEDTNAVATPAGAQSVGFTVGGTGLGGWAFSGASFGPSLGFGINNFQFVDVGNGMSTTEKIR